MMGKVSPVSQEAKTGFKPSPSFDASWVECKTSHCESDTTGLKGDCCRAKCAVSCTWSCCLDCELKVN